MSKRPHEGPGVVGGRGGVGVGLHLSIKEVGSEDRWGGAFSHFGDDKFLDLAKLKNSTIKYGNICYGQYGKVWYEYRMVWFMV